MEDNKNSRKPYGDAADYRLELHSAPPGSPTPAARSRVSERERKARRRRNRRRKLRNWALFISACAALVGVMTGTILWALPHAAALLAGEREFEAPVYDTSSYYFDATDEKLVLVNNNLPLGSGQPQLAIADDATGQQLETEAAAAYRAMAAAAAQDGIELVLSEGWQSEERRTEAFEAEVQKYLDRGLSREDAEACAKTIVPLPSCAESGTGLAADILCNEYGKLDEGFAETDAYRWLCAYAAGYGFILRWPEDCQLVTGMSYEPWHWRYVGVENAKAIYASGLCLEEFIAINQLNAD